MGTAPYGTAGTFESALSRRPRRPGLFWPSHSRPSGPPFQSKRQLQRRRTCTAVCLPPSLPSLSPLVALARPSVMTRFDQPPRRFGLSRSTGEFLSASPCLRWVWNVCSCCPRRDARELVMRFHLFELSNSADLNPSDRYGMAPDGPCSSISTSDSWKHRREPIHSTIPLNTLTRSSFNHSHHPSRSRNSAVVLPPDRPEVRHAVQDHRHTAAITLVRTCRGAWD